MKEFPKILVPANQSKFGQYSYNRLKCRMRKNIYEYIIANKQGEYYSFESDIKELGTVDRKKIIDELKQELIKLGWNVATTFGNTGLFVYGDKKPDNLYEDEELS